jgi:peptide/nickel transport system substrate-binding protein
MRIKNLYNSWSHNERLIFFGAALIFVASFFIWSFIFIQTYTVPMPANGGSYREGIVGQPVFINPIIPSTDTDKDLSKLIFSNITRLADSIKRESDNKTYTVRLKENLKWQDGEKITTDDIVFTMQTIQNPDAHSPLATSFQGVKVERVSELEIKFILQNPYAFFEEDHLKNFYVIPKHIFTDTAVENLKFSVYGLKPVGSGPYSITSYKSDIKGFVTSINLRENSKYSGKKPYTSYLTFKFYKNTADLIKSYNSGQIDGLGLSTSEPLSEITLRNKTTYFQSSREYAAFINQTTDNIKLKDINVRRALSESVDRNSIISSIFNGHATPIYGPTKYTKEPLNDANLSVLNGVEITLTVPNESFLVKTAGMLKSTWESHGAKITLRVMSTKDIEDNVLRTTDYQMLIFGNIIKQGEDLYAFWDSSRRFYPDENLSLYQNTTIDNLLEDYRRNFDGTSRNTRLANISNLIAADFPAIFLYSPDYIYVSTPKLGGLDTTRVINTSADRFDTIEKWYVETSRKFQ